MFLKKGVDRSPVCTLVRFVETAFICMPEIRSLLSSRARLIRETGIRNGTNFHLDNASSFLRKTLAAQQAPHHLIPPTMSGLANSSTEILFIHAGPF